MARGFRYYGKKRGNRRTGSPALGSIGEAVFFAAMLLLGCGGLVKLSFLLIVPQWRVNHEFIETTCKVVKTRIDERKGEDSPVYRPEIEIEYLADGVAYRGSHYDFHRAYSPGHEKAKTICGRFVPYDPKKDNRYPCWYDPADPSVCVLVRGYGVWVWLAFAVPLSFIVIGAVGLIYSVFRWGKSTERRAALARRAARRRLFGSDDSHRYPFVPEGGDIINSPGTRLKFRLPMANSPGWALFGTLAFCVGWNGIVVVAALLLSGQSKWLLAIFLTPFVLIGLGSIGVLFRQLFKAAGVGPTLVEISDHPLYPGQRYRVFLSQSGRLKVQSLRLALVCQETATYRQGTDTRSECREVFRQELFRRDEFKIQSGQPFESDIELDVPASAMHSFASSHNEIGWKLVVEGQLAGWPDYCRAFTVIVRPRVGDLPE